MNKPSWFQPLDLIPILLAALIAAYAFIHGYESEHNVQAAVLLVSVPVLMTVLWGRVMWLRKKWLDRCAWFPQYRCLVDTEKTETSDGYLLPAEQEWNAFIGSVVRSWIPFHPGAERLLKSRTKIIRFRKNMDEKPINPNWGLAYGFTVAGGSSLYINYNSKLDLLESTALAHELGHVIHGLATGSWVESEHHAFAQKNGLR